MATFNFDIQGPSIEGPPLQSNAALQGPPAPTLTDILMQQMSQPPEYTFGSPKQYVVGQLTNLVGSAFGNSDLGNELFGSKEEDSKAGILGLIIQLIAG